MCRISSLNAQHVKPWSRWATAAEDHTGCCSCQLRTGHRGYNSHRIHQNWTIQHCKNIAWSDESWFLLRHSDVRVRIWRKEHESMDPSCLVSTVQAGGGGVMVWGIFSWHTLDPLVPTEHRLNATAYLSIDGPCPSLYYYSVPIFWCYFQQDNATMSQSSNHLRLVSWTWQWVHFTQMASTVTRSQSNRAPLGCAGTRFTSWMCSRQICSNCVTLSCQCEPNNLWGMFPTPCWIYATKN